MLGVSSSSAMFPRARRLISRTSFSHTPNKSDHRDNLPEGTPVVFQHALTAVKFAIKNYDAENNVTIKSITVSGLVGDGTCVLDPNAAAKTDRVKWTLPEEPDITGKYASGDFGAPVDFKKKADGGGSFTNNGDFPDSFAAAGNSQNLNDGDASQTFWFIPQAITEDVILTISYTYGSTEVRTGVLEFGKVLSTYDTVWGAGELRTYTIKVDEVNVRIMDDVTIQGSADTGYGTSYKDNVVITNTGNTKAFIRAAIVGQWLDYLDRPVFGFTDKVNQLYLVESWYEDQFVNKGRDQGLFVGLPGYNGNGDNPLRDWTLCEDGYYYYILYACCSSAIRCGGPCIGQHQGPVHILYGRHDSEHSDCRSGHRSQGDAFPVGDCHPGHFGCQD